jgi:uncharacterized protein YfdQ (DUF2303 family)
MTPLAAIAPESIEALSTLLAASLDIKEAGESMHLVIPEGYKHVDLTKAIEAAGPAPARKKGTVQLTDVASFTQYLADQAHTDQCYIYADMDSRTLTAVINDHMAGDESAGWRDHRAVYTAELSRELATWMKFDGEKLDQEAFAVFLEDNIADVVEPSGETLLQVALTLQATTGVDFKSHRRLDNGQVQLGYTETTTATAGADGSLTIPREFTIGLRMFRNAVEGYRIRARLKYRLGGGKLKFWYELDRVQNAIEDNFKEHVTSASASGFTVLMGKPGGAQ